MWYRTERAPCVFCDDFDPLQLEFDGNGSVPLVVTNGRKTCVVVPGSTLFRNSVQVTEDTLRTTLDDAVMASNVKRRCFRVVPAVTTPNVRTRVLTVMNAWPWTPKACWQVLRALDPANEDDVIEYIAKHVIAPSQAELFEAMVPCKQAVVTEESIVLQRPNWHGRPFCIVTWLISTGRESTSKWGVVLKLPRSLEIFKRFAEPWFADRERLLWSLLKVHLKGYMFAMASAPRDFFMSNDKTGKRLDKLCELRRGASDYQVELPRHMQSFQDWFLTLNVTIKADTLKKLKERRTDFENTLKLQFKRRSMPYKFPRCTDTTRRPFADGCMRCVASADEKKLVCRVTDRSTPLTVWATTEKMPLCLRHFDGSKKNGGDRARLDAAALVTRFYHHFVDSKKVKPNTN